MPRASAFNIVGYSASLGSLNLVPVLYCPLLVDDHVLKLIAVTYLRWKADMITMSSN